MNTTSLLSEMSKALLDIEVVYKYVDYQGMIKMIEYQTLLFKKPSKFNDPFDSHPKLIDFDALNNEFFIDSFQKSLNNLLEEIGITCFSKCKNSLLMWSHYADKHKGICIEYDFKRLLNNLNESGHMIPCLVKYQNNFEKSKYCILSEEEDKVKAFVNLYSSKAQDWSYEKEIRILNTNLSSFDEDGNSFLNFDLGIIKNIYLGCRFEYKNLQNLNRLIQDNGLNVGVNMMELSDNSFSVKVKNGNMF